MDKANKFLNLNFVSILHKRQVISNEVKETLHFNVFLNNNIFPSKELFGLDLEINEFRFPALIEKNEISKAVAYRSCKRYHARDIIGMYSEEGILQRKNWIRQYEIM